MNNYQKKRKIRSRVSRKIITPGNLAEKRPSDLKSSSNRQNMSKQNESLAQDIIDILDQRTVPIVDIPETPPDSDLVEYLSETIEILSISDEAAEIVSAGDDVIEIEVAQPGDARKAETDRLIQQAEEQSLFLKAGELSEMLSRQEAQLNENPESNDLNNNDSESGKSDSSLLPELLITLRNESDPLSTVEFQLFSQTTKISLRKLILTKDEINDITLKGLNLKTWAPTYAKFSFSFVRGFTPSNSSDSEYETISENSSHPYSSSSLDSEDVELMKTMTNVEDFIVGRSSWKCPGFEAGKFCWICNGTIENKRDSDCGNSACCDHGRGNGEKEEDSESEMDIGENLVQDEQGDWHVAVTETQEDYHPPIGTDVSHSTENARELSKECTRRDKWLNQSQ